MQVRDQEDAQQREARLATDRDHHALVRDLFTVHSQALVRQYNKGHNQSCSSFSIKVVLVTCCRLGQIGCRCEIKKMLSNERLDWPTRDITRLWSDLFTVCSQALVRRYNKGHHQSYSSSSIKVVVVRLGQIGFRCEIKKMLSSERLDWRTRDIARLWSDLVTVYSHASVRTCQPS